MELQNPAEITRQLTQLFCDSPLAMSRNLLTLVWHMLTTRMPYTEPDPELRRKQQREDQIQHHIRRLRQLGVEVPTPEGASDLGSPAPLKGNRPRSPEAPGFHAR